MIGNGSSENGLIRCLGIQLPPPTKPLKRCPSHVDDLDASRCRRLLGRNGARHRRKLEHAEPRHLQSCPDVHRSAASVRRCRASARRKKGRRILPMPPPPNASGAPRLRRSIRNQPHASGKSAANLPTWTAKHTPKSSAKNAARTLPLK